MSARIRLMVEKAHAQGQMEEAQQNSSFVPNNISGSKNVYEWVESQDFNIRSPNIVDNYTSPDLPSENDIEDVHKFSLQSGSNPIFVTEDVNDFPLCNESNPQLVSKSSIKNVTEDVCEFPICNKSNLRLVLNNNFGNDPKYCSTEQGKIYTDMCKLTCSSIISGSSEEMLDNSPEKFSSEIPYQENIQFNKDRSYLSPCPKMRKISSTKKIHVISNISLSSLENISPEKTVITTEHFEVQKSVSKTIKLNSESSNKIETISSAEDSVLNKNIISDEETKRFDIIESHSSSSSDNNLEDKDFYPSDSSTKSDSDKESNGSDFKDLLKPQSQKIRESKNRQQKLIRCKFCQDDVSTKNFTRYIERKHAAEEEVKKILSYPKNSRERRQAFILFRNNTNFDLFISGIMRPNRQLIEKDPNTVYYPCAYCKGIYMRGYLKRHAKFCPIKTANKNRKNHISASQTFTACAMDITNVVSKLNVKQQVSWNFLATLFIEADNLERSNWL